jgi:hypothetical protein
MRKSASLATLMLALLVLPASAVTLQRRATMVRGGGNGKCTIEVEVDGAAEVEVSGDMGTLRTLSGQTAVWRRFECNGPLPRNPGDFRFRGIDGRGRVELLRDPRDRGGRAVVRIEDPQGGREGYTFDLEWRGGGGGAWETEPPPFRPGLDRGPGPDRGPGFGSFPAERAIQICQDGVVARLNQDGYRDVNFERTVPDNNPGRNDWIVGTVTGRRGRRPDVFSFSCSVDFRSGRVRSVDVRRR